MQALCFLAKSPKSSHLIHPTPFPPLLRILIEDITFRVINIDILNLRVVFDLLGARTERLSIFSNFDPPFLHAEFYNYQRNCQSYSDFGRAYSSPQSLSFSLIRTVGGHAIFPPPHSAPCMKRHLFHPSPSSQL